VTDHELFAREHEFAKELSEIESQITKLNKREIELNQLLDKCQSKRWIRANNVTLDDITISGSLADSIARKVPNDMPYFTVVNQFKDWMQKNDIRTRYFEWNKRIYNRLEFYESNRLPSRRVARIEDVPGYVEI